MKLPNGHKAVVDLTKLRDYCLNPTHPRGRHKARVFAAALGLGAADAARLRDVLLAQALEAQAIATDRDAHGQRYHIDFSMPGLRGPVRVRSCWIVPSDEEFPRLSTCFVI